MVKLIGSLRWIGRARAAGRSFRQAGSAVSALLAELRLDRGDTRLEPGVFLARAGGHVLDRVELLAGDEIEPAERFLHPPASAFAGFAGHPGERAGGAVGELDEVGDDRVFALHGAYLVP